jgi:hypothetical protein
MHTKRKRLKTAIIISGLMGCVLCFTPACGDDDSNVETPDAGSDSGADAWIDGEVTGDALPQDGQLDGATPEPVDLGGAVQKGPFVLGSSIQVSTMDASGNPTGDNYNTETENDLGEFSVVVEHYGLLEIEGTGFYYNEITGGLSTASLTLRAWAWMEPATEKTAYLNLITHLTHARIETLMDQGEPFDSARDQAEQELRAQLQIGPPGYDPGLAGIEIDMLAGDDDPSAYLFAISTVLAQVAATRAGSQGSVDANLQELLNSISLDLSEDGALMPVLQAEINAAESMVDSITVEQDFAARLLSIGSSATVPDIDRILDWDGDGIANRDDNCPRQPNPNQQPVDGLCGWRVREIDDIQCKGKRFFSGTFDGDAYLDLVGLLPYGQADHILLLGDGGGGFAISQIDDPGDATAVNQPWGLGADTNGDQYTDLVVCDGPSSPPCWTVYSNGDGTFAQEGDLVVGWSGLINIEAFAFHDVDDDGYIDALCLAQTSGSVIEKDVFVAGGRPGGGWDAWVASGIKDEVSGDLGAGFAVADFDEDGVLDIVVTDSAGSFYVFTGDGSGAYTLATQAQASGMDSFEIVLAGDLDHDGHQDLIGRLSGSWTLIGMHGDGQGVLEREISVDFSDHTNDYYDLAVVGGSSGRDFLALKAQTTDDENVLAIYTSDGTGLSLQATFSGVPEESEILTGDIDGNGQDDVLVAPYALGHEISRIVQVILNP